MSTLTGSAIWEGTLKDGKGKMKLGSGAFESPSFASRFVNGTGTNAEELIGAAEAGLPFHGLVAWVLQGRLFP